MTTDRSRLCRVLDIAHLGCVDEMLQLADPRLHETLVVLGCVVVGVLTKIAVGSRPAMRSSISARPVVRSSSSSSWILASAVGVRRSAVRSMEKEEVKRPRLVPTAGNGPRSTQCLS